MIIIDMNENFEEDGVRGKSEKTRDSGEESP